MARAKAAKKSVDATTDENIVPAAVSLRRTKGLVFISHDSRDADLAEAFSNLLLDVSGGLLKSFRSSDKKGTSGIDFGDEWYGAILSQLGDATDVVALLSQQSIDRPWILYEAGLARGKLDTRVIGVALGVPLDRLITGPFGQFQNCADDEESQTKLVMQLLQQNPDATPREEAVRREVRLFREKVVEILKSRGKNPEKAPENIDAQHTAKLFEEVKSMIRDLPERIDGHYRFQRGSVRKSRRILPAIFEQVMFHPAANEINASTYWLIVMSLIRDDIPWLYEAGMELYRALRSPSTSAIRRAKEEFLATLQLTLRGPLFRDLLGGDEKDSYFFLQHMDVILDRVVEMRADERRALLQRQTEKNEASQ